jgi:hypothetical protein
MKPGNHSLKLPRGGTRDLADGFNLDLYLPSKPLLNAVGDFLHIPLVIALCWYHLYSDVFKRFLDDLTFLHMRLVDENSVKAYQSPSIWPYNHILNAAENFFQNRHLPPTGARLGIPGSHIPQTETDQWLVFTGQPRCNNFTRLAGQAAATIGAQDLDHSHIWTQM